MGIAVRALPLQISTRATPTKKMVETFPGISTSMNGLTDGVPNCEPAAVCAYRCRSTLTFKLVFWFAAEADSTDLPDYGSREPWEQTLEMEWVGAGEAAGRMTDVADGQVIDKVLADMRQSGYNI
ncbi:hypothetical protein NQ176_g10242 [Zarea fungicola]|uniref:Uncharacterized protein n=1 Tax=Zarea fungicola TaxID=93591 RepID=A0ACC1MHN3_9HYPO|nr:hypothetical protein NQ176_g10242 [Lecanicillium fungicola]